MILAIAAYRRTHSDATEGTRPPLVPLFVAGFFAAVLVRSFVPLPDSVLAGGRAIQTILLAVAMFALGTGVRLDMLRRVGPGRSSSVCCPRSSSPRSPLGGVLVTR